MIGAISGILGAAASVAGQATRSTPRTHIINGMVYPYDVLCTRCRNTWMDPTKFKACIACNNTFLEPIPWSELETGK
jgi:hypothetical protein